MKGKNLKQRGAQGKHAAGAEKTMAQHVMELFHVNAVVELRVSNYHQMREHEKKLICHTLMGVTLCKVPARDGNAMLFYLWKGGRV